MPRIRIDDLVEVISGNDTGKRGRVLKIIPDKDRVVVQGVNLRWKHLRKSQSSPQGGRIRKEMPVHESNVMLVDAVTDTRSRIGSATVDGKKVRVARKTGNAIGTSVPTDSAKAAKKEKE